jgi:hypothetical protein
MGDRKSGGVPDGKDIEAFDGATPRALIYQRGEVFRRAPMMGFIAAGSITVACSPDARRNSARIRATTSMIENGFGR